MSYYLGRLGREHVVIERGRVAERWRSERWDSLAFQFPNWTLRLPGHVYEGDRPDGFMGRDGVVSFLEEYARRIAAPVRCGVRVIGVDSASRGRFRIKTDHLTLEAVNVVVATGPYQQPLVPACSNALPLSVFQLTANCYTNPRQLPDGSVLIIGSGGSGCQIAEDLLAAGRRVYLAVGRHWRVPRRYRGQDFVWWQEKMGALDTTVDELRRGMRGPLLTGVAGGHDVDLRQLATHGATLLGRLRDICGGKAWFAADLEDNLLRGDAAFQHFKHIVDCYVSKNGLAAPQEGDGRLRRAQSPPSIEYLDLKSAGIACVIWALGYRYDFGWLNSSVFNGGPVHRRGVTDVRGLYFLGLARLHKVKSAFLWGVGEDAAHLAERIVTPARETP